MRVLSKVVLVATGLGIALIAISTNAFQRRFAIPGPATKAEVERGRYLVEEVAKCPECHTPRKPNGELDAAGSADLDQAGRRHSELGGPRPGAGRFAKSYRGPGGESIGGWNGTEWTGVASSNADLPYGAG